MRFSELQSCVVNESPFSTAIHVVGLNQGAGTCASCLCFGSEVNDLREVLVDFLTFVKGLDFA